MLGVFACQMLLSRCDIVQSFCTVPEKIKGERTLGPRKLRFGPAWHPFCMRIVERIGTEVAFDLGILPIFCLSNVCSFYFLFPFESERVRGGI